MWPLIQIHLKPTARRIPPTALKPTSDSETDSDREKCPISTFQAIQALLILANAAAERDSELENYSVILAYECDEEKGSTCQFFDNFNETGGAGAILSITNFSMEKFQKLWDLFGAFIELNYNIRKRRKSDITDKDALFMMLAILKAGCQ